MIRFSAKHHERGAARFNAGAPLGGRTRAMATCALMVRTGLVVLLMWLGVQVGGTPTLAASAPSNAFAAPGAASAAFLAPLRDAQAEHPPEADSAAGPDQIAAITALVNRLGARSAGNLERVSSIEVLNLSVAPAFVVDARENRASEARAASAVEAARSAEAATEAQAATDAAVAAALAADQVQDDARAAALAATQEAAAAAAVDTALVADQADDEAHVAALTATQEADAESDKAAAVAAALAADQVKDEATVAALTATHEAEVSAAVAAALATAQVKDHAQVAALTATYEAQTSAANATATAEAQAAASAIRRAEAAADSARASAEAQTAAAVEHNRQVSQRVTTLLLSLALLLGGFLCFRFWRSRKEPFVLKAQPVSGTTHAHA